MKKIIVIFILLFVCHSIYAEKYAIIVAVGNYPKSTGWGTISSINDVPLIKETLLNQEFKAENISILIDDEATYKGIKNALNSLLTRIKPDDIVVLHFSMHGQQIFDDNGEEIDGKDEALVPYDAWVRYNHNYKGENHFRDDEIGNYITKFRNALHAHGQLLLLLDSCHSGSTTRGGVSRGSKAVFAPIGWKPNKNGNPTGSDMYEDSIEKINIDAAPFVLISGASANELNYEYKGTGSLSYAFAKAMSNLGSNYSYNQLFAKIETEMNIISPNQNPTIEGDLNVELFNNNYIKQQPYFKVKSILRADVIKIQAGKLHGLFKNTTVNILTSGTTKASEENIITNGTITFSKFNEAIIKLDKPLDDLNEKKYWVFVDKPSYEEMSINVFFDKTLKDEPIKLGVSSFLSKNKLGEIVKHIDSSDVVLMQKNNFITLNATNGLEAVDKDNDARGSITIEEINNRLSSFAHGQYLKKLDFKNYDYEFEFKLIPIEYDILNDEEGALLDSNNFVNANGTFQVRPEIDNVKLQVTNKSKKPLYFSIVEINSKGEVFPFLPNDNCVLNNDERKLSPGQTEVFECRFSFESPYEKLILKGFAAPYPINFQSTVESRGEGSRSGTNPLENFLGNTYTQSRGGSGSSISNTKIDGFTYDFVYEIVRN
jgi:hypothetical protein